MTKNLGIFVLMLLIVSFLAVSTVSAQYTPSQLGSTKRFFIDKKILNPQTQQYVDNLSIDQYLFIPSQTVDFQLVVTNSGSDDLNTVDVIDQLPPQLSYISGGTVDKGGQIHFSIDKLSSNQSQTFLLKAKVNVDQNTTGTICPVNLAQAKTQTNSLLDQDTSVFCIQKQLSAVKQLPSTGPEGLILTLIAAASGVAAGVRLIRVGRRYKADETDYQITENMISKKGRG